MPEQTELRDLDQLRHDLMRATLAHAAFDGWTWTAIRAAADDIGVDRLEAESAFPDGPAELIELFSEEADLAMIAEMEQRDTVNMRVRDRVALGVRVRLEQNIEHQEALRRALSFLALPQNAGLSLKLLYRTVDAVWTAAGDASADYNFYSKRALLAGVYSATLLYWLEDRSEGQERTWDFLDRRIEEVVRVGGRLGKTLKRLEQVPDALYRMRPRDPRNLRMRG
jgi:ubiquinone biosynthesis protein COQ9